MKDKLVLPESGYSFLLKEIKERITSARINASRSINKELIRLYWDIGRMIVLKQKKYKWGDNIVENLAKDLQEEIPGNFGFSSRNLWQMRRFYEEYKHSPILQQVVAELPWGQNLVILQMVKNAEEREYYIKATAEMGWSSCQTE